MIVEKIKDQGFPLARSKSAPLRLDHQNWVPADHVKASFEIKHDGSSIYLRYVVEEEHVRAVNTAFNSAVWEDSCVEFFFSLPADKENYYNFEFNAIGTVLGAYGKDRNSRKWLPPDYLEQIETYPSLGRDPIENIDEFTQWSLQARIPVSVLKFSEIKDLSGMDGHGNFYKCGDKLKEPHFLSWKPVLNPTPDFHLPRYFGQLAFI